MEQADAATVTEAKKKPVPKKKGKGNVNAYGYTDSALAMRARCAGQARVHKLTGKVADQILESNVRNAIRVAATRAVIAKHRTVRLDYLADSIRQTSGSWMLGHRTIGKHWRAASSSSAARKKKKAAAAAAVAVVKTAATPTAGAATFAPNECDPSENFTD